MTQDNWKHRKIRIKVLEYLSQIDSLNEEDILSSHDGDTDINTSFYNENGKEIKISQPDIVV